MLSMGKILAYSGLMEDKEVTWMPAYGPEQRGGTANVTVIVSDERISSPIILGGLLKVAPVVSDKGVEKALYKTLPERHHGLIPLNMEALKEGAKIIEEVK